MKNGLHIDEAGTKHWYLHGKRHRQDGPAVVDAHGSEFWYLHDKRHRQDGPAEVLADGTKCWFLHDKRHREDGPAVVCTDGTEYWYLDGNYLGKGVEGFWAHWKLLTLDEQNNLNLHIWLAKYT